MSDEPLKGTDPISIRNFFRDLTWNEIHLFWLGLYSGFVAVRPKARQEPNEETKRLLNWTYNEWYWKTGYIVGYALKAILVAVGGFQNQGLLTSPL